MIKEQFSLVLIERDHEGGVINQRSSDGYIDATAMCRSANKRWFDYSRQESSKLFIDELSRSTGIPADLLVEQFTSGINEQRGTWIHPHIAINLAQWLSPKFAVQVSQWVHEWMSGGLKTPAALPYHLQRYVANRHKIPADHFSILTELTTRLIAPLEQSGYELPERLMPDISEGRMFCKFLRDELGIDTNVLPTYVHEFPDGRRVKPKLYPIDILPDFIRHFHGVWLPTKSVAYFEKKDKTALKHLHAVLRIEKAS